MRSRFVSGVVAGSLIGASAGMYALYKTTPRQRRRIMKRGAQTVRNASRIMDVVSSVNMFR